MTLHNGQELPVLLEKRRPDAYLPRLGQGTLRRCSRR